ncbi:MAG: hypothetical protein ABIG85_05415 [Chloroflexota bacterium]
MSDRRDSARSDNPLTLPELARDARGWEDLDPAALEAMIRGWIDAFLLAWTIARHRTDLLHMEQDLEALDAADSPDVDRGPPELRIARRQVRRWLQGEISRHLADVARAEERLDAISRAGDVDVDRVAGTARLAYETRGWIVLRDDDPAASGGGRT